MARRRGSEAEDLGSRPEEREVVRTGPAVGRRKARTGIDIFQETIQKSILLLKEIEAELGWPEERRIQSHKALTIVLRTLRDRLTVEQAAKLGAQLPALIRGYYYEGWVPSQVPVKMNKEEFLNTIRREFTYSVDMGFETFVRTVLGVLSKSISRGEIDDVKASLPAELAALFD